MTVRWEVWGWYHPDLGTPAGPVASYRLRTLARLHAWWFGIVNPEGSAWVARHTTRSL